MSKEILTQLQSSIERENKSSSNNEKTESLLVRNKRNNIKSKSNTSNTSTAQRRWRILARALTGLPEYGEDEDISVRRFTSFGLLRVTHLENALSDPDSSWYEYSAMLDNEHFNVQIRKINKSFTANELIGFNNTGNVCVWPSEECLAYYLLKNRGICRNKNVLELGGGMSCLAGILVAKYCNPRAVTLTDGNVTSIDNVRCIVVRNYMTDFVECGVVQWAKAARALRHAAAGSGNHVNRIIKTSHCIVEDHERNTNGCGDDRIERPYDVILCADCLFFDETRLDLVETIYGWLADDGVALVIAPRRGLTFQKFAEAAIKRGFVPRQSDRYDSKVWSRHLELLEQSQEYCPDLHYPVLLELTKQKKMPEG